MIVRRRATEAWRLWRGAIKRSYAFTFGAEFVNVGCSVVAVKLAAAELGSEGFGEYALARRIMSLAAYPLLLGLGISIPRYVAWTQEAAGPGGGDVYLLGGIALCLPLVAALFAAAWAMPGAAAQLVFGSADHSALIVPVALAVTGLCLHTLVYAYLRGRLRMWLATSLNLVNTGLLPVVALVVERGSAAAVLMVIGVASIGVSSAAGLYVVLTMRWRAIAAAEVVRAARALAIYGLPRVPGEFALFGLFALPVLLVAHKTGIREAGFFSFSLTALQILGSAYTVLGILLLPHISRIASAQQWERAQQVVATTTRVVVVTVLPAICLGELGAQRIVLWLMGPEFAEAVSSVRWILLAGVPYVLYLALRNPLDAVSMWPFNSVNLVAGLGATAVILVIAPSRFEPAAAMLVGLTVLGGLSGLCWWRVAGRPRAAAAQGAFGASEEAASVAAT